MDVEDNLLEPESLMRYSNVENISQVEGELRWQLKEQTDRQSNTGRGEGEIESSACLSPPCVFKRTDTCHQVQCMNVKSQDQ